MKKEESKKLEKESQLQKDLMPNFNIKGHLLLRKNLRPKIMMYFFKTQQVDQKFEIVVYKAGSEKVKETWLFDHDTVVS